MCLKFDLGGSCPPDSNLSVFIQHWIINPVLLDVSSGWRWGWGIVFQEEYQSICYLPVRLLRCAEGFRGAVHGGAGLKVEGVHRESSRAKTRICTFHLLKPLFLSSLQHLMPRSITPVIISLSVCLSSLQCITDLHRSHGINSSRDLPDNVLTFARRHPLMASQVHPIGLRPLMFKRSVNYVKIAVHKEPALDGNIYTVLFLGTGEFYYYSEQIPRKFQEWTDPSKKFCLCCKKLIYLFYFSLP